MISPEDGERELRAAAFITAAILAAMMLVGAAIFVM